MRIPRVTRRFTDEVDGVFEDALVYVHTSVLADTDAAYFEDSAIGQRIRLFLREQRTVLEGS